MAGFHTQIRLTSYEFEDAQITVKLSGSPTQSDIGKALTQDLTADNTMKLAGDGDPIHGVLKTLENRTVEGQVVGTCAFRFATTLPIKSGLTGGSAVTRGCRLIGAGAGEVKAVDLNTLITASPTQAGVAAAIKAYANSPICWAVNGLVADATKFA